MTQPPDTPPSDPPVTDGDLPPSLEIPAFPKAGELAPAEPEPPAATDARLSARRERFCRYYLTEPSATRAAAKAGYSEQSEKPSKANPTPWLCLARPCLFLAFRRRKSQGKPAKAKKSQAASGTPLARVRI
jgi:hypothetical protein